MNDPYFERQVANNPDLQNSRLALEKLIENAINMKRRHKVALWRNYANDAAFKQAFDASIARIVANSQTMAQQ